MLTTMPVTKLIRVQTVGQPDKSGTFPEIEVIQVPILDRGKSLSMSRVVRVACLMLQLIRASINE